MEKRWQKQVHLSPINLRWKFKLKFQNMYVGDYSIDDPFCSDYVFWAIKYILLFLNELQGWTQVRSGNWETECWCLWQSCSWFGFINRWIHRLFASAWGFIRLWSWCWLWPGSYSFNPSLWFTFGINRAMLRKKITWQAVYYYVRVREDTCIYLVNCFVIDYECQHLGCWQDSARWACFCSWTYQLAVFNRASSKSWSGDTGSFVHLYPKGNTKYLTYLLRAANNINHLQLFLMVCWCSQ